MRHKIKTTAVPGSLSKTFEVGQNPALFDGHFPGHPILPGAKLLDLVVQNLREAGALRDGPIEIVSAKFLATVAPASLVRLSWTAKIDGSCRFVCTQGDQSVATGVLRHLQKSA